MGCISSKILTKSSSFREDLCQRSNRKSMANGIPILDELYISGYGTSVDHKLLIKSQNESLKLPAESSLDPTNAETINTWELMAGLEEHVVESTQDVQAISLMSLSELDLATSKLLSIDKVRRSKSCGWSLGDEGFDTDQVFEGLHEEKSDRVMKGVGRSRSFHTVEDYDSMLQRMLLSSSQNDGNNNIKLSCSYNGIDELSSFKDDDMEKGSVCETGSKRKAMAKGLESLRIPSAVELQSIGSLEEWLHADDGGGCVGSYVTAKVGFEDKTCFEFGKEWKEESVFDPEMLAAFEEFIQQFESEEERDQRKFDGS